MKQLLITLLLLIVVMPYSFSQKKKKEKIPKEVRRSIPLMTKRITQNCHSEQEKVDSIYHWITHNIEYDYKVLQKTKPLLFQSPTETLKSKKAVCSGYVYLMIAMLNEVGIKSEYIEGYTRPYEMDTTFSIIDATHAWIAIKVNDEWKLADPTWDAGYIGRIPKEKETYPNRWLKVKTFKRKKRENRRNNRIKKKKEAFDKKQAEQEPYTNQFGFVFQPEKDWYLIDKDSFLLTHLPTIPQWQLKNTPITMLQFCDKDAKLPEQIAHPKGNKIDFQILNDEYTAKNLLDKWLYTAELGHKFNEDNYGVKAVHYNNFISALLDENFKKEMSHLPLEHSIPIYETLYSMSDTVVIFSKAALDMQKQMYKGVKKDMADKFKKEDLWDKNHEKGLKNVDKNIEKIYVAIDKTKERNKKENTLTLNKIEELSVKYPNMDASVEIPEADRKNIAVLLNSFDSLAKSTDDYYTSWRKAVDSTSLQNMYDASAYGDYYLRMNEQYLSFNSMGFQKDITEMDSLSDFSILRISRLIQDSLMREIPSKEPFANLKAMEQLIKKYKPVLKTLEAEKKITNAANIEYYLYTHYFHLMEKHADFTSDANSYCYFLQRSMKEFEKEMDQLADSSGAVEEGKVKRRKHLNEELDKSNQRNSNLYNETMKNGKKWKSIFKDKM